MEKMYRTQSIVSRESEPIYFDEALDNVCTFVAVFHGKIRQIEAKSGLFLKITNKYNNAKIRIFNYALIADFNELVKQVKMHKLLIIKSLGNARSIR